MRLACQGASNLGMRYCRTYVIAFLCACLLSTAPAQVAKRRVASKGPRALGLIEVDSKGRGHLIPITIMLDGRFYDASAYKADPIPMALQPGTVYEGAEGRGVARFIHRQQYDPAQRLAWLGELEIPRTDRG